MKTGHFHEAGNGFELAFFQEAMRISLMIPEGDPEAELAGGALSLVETLEGDKEFLEALSMRLEEIVRKPTGRFVISYQQGQPGARRPPRIQ